MAETTEQSDRRWCLRSAHLLLLAAGACVVAACVFWDAHWLPYAALSVALALALASTL